MNARVPAKILIIDDDESNRRLIEIFAKADGYLTTEAANGKDGLALAVSDLPDLILIDLMMPGMDGFELIHSLRNNSVTRDIPIVVASAVDDPAAYQRLQALGANAFISKPIDRWELAQCLAKMLPGDPDANSSPGT